MFLIIISWLYLGLDIIIGYRYMDDEKILHHYICTFPKLALVVFAYNIGEDEIRINHHYPISFDGFPIPCQTQ